MLVITSDNEKRAIGVRYLKKYLSQTQENVLDVKAVNLENDIVKIQTVDFDFEEQVITKSLNDLTDEISKYENSLDRVTKDYLISIDVYKIQKFLNFVKEKNRKIYFIKEDYLKKILLSELDDFDTILGCSDMFTLRYKREALQLYKSYPELFLQMNKEIIENYALLLRYILTKVYDRELLDTYLGNLEKYIELKSDNNNDKIKELFYLAKSIQNLKKSLKPRA